MSVSAAADVRFQPVGTTFGARVHGVDLTQPVTASRRRIILDGLHQHRVLLFRGQQLSADELVEFGRIFGRLDDHGAEPDLKRYLVADRPEVLMIGNVFKNGESVGYYNNDNEEWHADYSWSKGRASLGSMLYATEAPAEGGATLFADSTAAYDDLPEPVKRRIDYLHAVHSLTSLQQRQAQQTPDRTGPAPQHQNPTADVLQPLVRVHPVTGLRSLLLGTMEIHRIAELDDDEGRTLLDELTAHVAEPRYRYRQEWQVGDLVVWDNLAVLHAATFCDRHRFRRMLYRTTFFD